MACSHNIRLLCLALLTALAIAGLSASNAIGIAWTIEGKTLAEQGLSEESIISSATPLTIEVPALFLKVECELEKGSGKIISPRSYEATMELSKCKVPASKVCTVSEPILLKAKAELTKKAGIVYAILKPLVGETFGTFTVKGEECAAAKEFKLTGSTAAQPSLEEALKEPLKFSKAIAEAAGTKMLAGASAAFLIGTSNEELSGLKKGKKWTVCALCPFSFEPEEGYAASNPAQLNVMRLTEGDGVNVGTGNLTEQQNDLATGGRGPGLQLTRYYNSQLAAKALTPGPFGYGWTSTFGASLTVSEVAETAIVRNDNGSTVIFVLIEGKYLAAPWVQATLVKEGTNYVYTLPNQTKLLFNSSGRLIKETDRHGNAITLAYNASNQLETATDSAGRKLTFAYNANGRVETVKDPMGHTATYSYEANELVKVTLPGEAIGHWEFKYDASHQMTKLIDGRAKAVTNEYDGSNRVKLQTDALERKRGFEYKETAGIKETTVTEPNGSKTLSKFNSAMEPTETTRALGTELAQTTKYEYDAAFDLKVEIDANNHATTFTYDGEGNVMSQKDANENETKWTYNTTHDLTSETTPRNNKTTINRNATTGDVESIKRPAPGATTQETKFEYAANGDVKSETDPLNHTTNFEYDAYGDLKAETNAAGDKTTWTYNEDGQQLTEVTPRGNEAGAEPAKFETKIERDLRGRPVKITDPLGHETKYKYDGAGNLEVVTNPNLHATTYVYDNDNECIEVKAANGNVSKTAYDSMGLVKSQTDANIHTYKYEHNLLEQVSEEIDPLERKTIRKYDPVGNLKEVKDGEGRTTTYTYDLGNRLKEVKYSEAATKPVSYVYDKDGNVTEMKDGTGTVKNAYDELGRMTETTNGNAEIIKYEYNLGNQTTKVIYPNTKVVTHTFDLAGRLETVKDWLGNETKFNYNRDSMPKLTTYPAGSTNKDEYEYNNADQLTKTTMLRGAATLASIGYTRDNAGQLKVATQTGLPGIAMPEYEYDEKERMKKGVGTAYEYDPANNLKKLGPETYSYDNANQLKEGAGTKFTFNKVGQRTVATPAISPATTYGYNQAGALISAKRPAEAEFKEINDTYAYDGNGLRTSQTINGTTTHMAWATAEALPLLLYDGTSYYLYGPEGLPFEQITAEVPTYLHHDQQGSTRLLTNAAGETKGTYTYTPYGATEGHTGTATTPLGYDGQYTSADTGLIYLRTRIYDPATAQFMSPDPLANSTEAPYYFAADSPVNGGDATGLDDPSDLKYNVFPILQHGGGVGINLAGSGNIGKYTVVGQWTALNGFRADASLQSTALQGTANFNYHDSSSWSADIRLNGSGENWRVNVFSHLNQSIWDLHAAGQINTLFGDASFNAHATPSAIDATFRAGGSRDGASWSVLGHVNQNGMQSLGIGAQASTPNLNFNLSGSWDFVHRHSIFNADLTGSRGSVTFGLHGQFSDGSYGGLVSFGVKF
jgi:RHS repeat-associated protein